VYPESGRLTRPGMFPPPCCATRDRAGEKEVAKI
jgi:hypothetical protein